MENRTLKSRLTSVGTEHEAAIEIAETLTKAIENKDSEATDLRQEKMELEEKLKQSDNELQIVRIQVRIPHDQNRVAIVAKPHCFSFSLPLIIMHFELSASFLALIHCYIKAPPRHQHTRCFHYSLSSTQLYSLLLWALLCMQIHYNSAIIYLCAGPTVCGRFQTGEM